MVVAAIAVLALASLRWWPLMVVSTAAFGVALGASTAGNQLALYAQSADDQRGTAAGFFRTFGYLGAIASSTVVGLTFQHHVTEGGLRTLGCILLGVSLLLLILTLGDRHLGTRGRPAPRGDKRCTTGPASGRGCTSPSGSLDRGR
jgi:MFS family permease